ncbi:unnamed protein product [Eruca vesicaria subsp. sativa]|uniref:Uncharacterized protein n=1 Tax=Eruca vesicaria subsp. sativa TaxID=29727 RepID=A0ABC8LJK4_ERUVS|nr:unnamed protein product [Eruca vesicaria subsp. sativa]
MNEAPIGAMDEFDVFMFLKLMKVCGGDTHLGGDDFDKIGLLQNSRKIKAFFVDLLKDKQALQRLTEAAEKAKIELSSLTRTNISLPFITSTASGPKHIETALTRAKFEELFSGLLYRCKSPSVENALKDAMLRFKDIDEVILVGGSTRIPAVQEVVRKMTGKEPNLAKVSFRKKQQQSKEDGFVGATVSTCSTDTPSFFFFFFFFLGFRDGFKVAASPVKETIKTSKAKRAQLKKKARKGKRKVAKVLEDSIIPPQPTEKTLNLEASLGTRMGLRSSVNECGDRNKPSISYMRFALVMNTEVLSHSTTLS